MPCQSDYLNATGQEIELSQMFCFLGELEGKPWNRDWFRGYHPAAYNRGDCDKKKLDEIAALLCSKLSNLDATKYSLELQIWWRDHQEADRARKEIEDLDTGAW